MSIPERNIHLNLWEVLRNVVVREKFTYENYEFVDVKFEPTINGRPDLVIEAVEKGKAKKIPLLVIETKRKVPYPDPRFDPYSMDVIKQAAGYAMQMGAPYFATCNGDILVVFDTFTVGVPLIQRRVKQYKVFFDEKFARILLRELVRFRLGVGKWLPLDDVFVERLRSFHRFISPFIYQALVSKLDEDSDFREEYVRWLRSQLFDYSDEVNKNIGEQMAYLLMNKILFYKTIETQIPELTRLKKIDAANGAEFSGKFQDHFEEVVSKADYEGIFKPTILDKVPLPDKLVYHLNEFIEELGAYNLAKIRSDVLGRVYEDLIPGDERHRLGQYYTPPPIVDLIVEMCIRSPNDKVLDPGCGSGSFLVKAYHKLKDLKRKENPFRRDSELHKELLGQVYGIDINPFPAQLSSINLAVRNLEVRSENLNLAVSDFFKVKPGMFPLPKEFDVVITNPPYTRQEEMEYKQQIRDAALTYTDGSKIDIDARAGIYAYFFTHSAKFLKNGGRMGYITSDTWLDVGFGKGLKKFFLDHFRILAIMWYDVRAFERALVGTCIPILEKEESSEEKRKENIVKFIRIKKPIPPQDVSKIIETPHITLEDQRVSVVSIRQSDLQPRDKWGKYLRAPGVFFKISQHPKMIQLSEIAKIRRGYTTGANEFFYLDKEKIRSWDIEEEYLRPVLTSPREVGYEIEPEEINRWVLTVHDTKAELVKKNANVLNYVEWGEKVETKIKGGRSGGTIVKGFHRLSTLKSRKIWYDLGERDPAPLLFSCKIWERPVFALNNAKVQADKSFYEIYPNSKGDLIVLAGILNSTVTAFLLELCGRFYGGGVLELEVYESKRLPVLDPSKLSENERKRIENAFLQLCEKERRGSNEEKTEAKKELDDAIFDVLGLTDKERKQVYDGLRVLRQMRLRRKEVDILVETGEEWKPPKKRGKRKKFPVEPHKRIDSYF